MAAFFIVCSGTAGFKVVRAVPELTGCGFVPELTGCGIAFTAGRPLVPK
jgi:hypothetical protein